MALTLKVPVWGQNAKGIPMMVLGVSHVHVRRQADASVSLVPLLMCQSDRPTGAVRHGFKLCFNAMDVQ